MSDQLELTKNLIGAIESNNLDLAKVFLDQGAQVDLQIPEVENMTPLIYASARNRPLGVKFLLSHGAKINQKDGKMGLSALHFAIANQSLDSAKILIENGADVNLVGPQNTTPLILASEHGYLQIAQLLISKGADPLIKGPDDYTARMVAESHQFKSLVTYLICSEVLLKKAKIGAALVSESELLRDFVLASQSGDSDRVKGMIDSGIDLNGQIEDKTALMVASVKSDLTTLKILIEKGANLNVQSITAKTTALHFALNSSQSGTIKLLVEKGADLNIADADGNPPLIYAVNKNLSEIVSLFLNKGANPNIKNKKGISALAIARSNGYKSIESLLLSKGAT